MKKTQYVFLLASLVIIGGFVVLAQVGAVEPDTAEPADISDLAVSDTGETSIDLTWMAPGDDGTVGTSTSYDLRYSTSTITGSNWDLASQVDNEPTPQIASSAESMTVSDLESSTTYYFAIKTKDEEDNESNISNVVSGITESDATAPTAISDLAVADIEENSIDLTWTAPGDDGSEGTSTSYDLRYSTSTITASNWSSASQASGEPTPQVADNTESMTVSDLASSTTYYFAIKTKDEEDNESNISNVVSVTTLTPEEPAELAEPDFNAEMRFTPQSFNPNSQGRWVSVHLFFATPYQAKDVNISTVELNGSLPADLVHRGINYFSRGNSDKERNRSNLVLKFSRSEFAGEVGDTTGEFTITVTGKVGDSDFSASDTINVLGSGQEVTSDDDDLITASGTPEVYIIKNGRKRHIPSVNAFNRRGFGWQNIKIVSSGEVDSYDDDELMKSDDDTAVFLIFAGMKRHIPSAEVFESYGFDWDDISVVSREELVDYVDVNLIREAGNTKVYLLAGGKKHWIPTLAVFNKHGYKWANVVIVNSVENDTVPDGDDLN